MFVIIYHSEVLNQQSPIAVAHTRQEAEHYIKHMTVLDKNKLTIEAAPTVKITGELDPQ